MPKKIYTHETVNYRSAGRKWLFVSSTPSGRMYQFSGEMPGGAETAHKVARQIAGAIARRGEMDNMGRSAIDRIVHEARHEQHMKNAA